MAEVSEVSSARANRAVTGIVYRFQRHALHDGPGIRTLVFLKGCPLRCLWCFSPESQRAKPEVIHHPEKCLGCEQCVEACPIIPGAIATTAGVKCIERSLCDGCGRCAAVCPTGGMEQIGEVLGADEVAALVERDRVFYDRSGGGVTLSGGEVTGQAHFACDILRRCQAAGIRTAIETCGYTSWENLQQLLVHTDLVLYDLKGMDAGKHLELTGVDNDVIRDNAKRVAHSGIPTIIRMPIVPGYTDASAELEKAARFISSQLPEIQSVHLLPYEMLGVAKYEALGREYSLTQVEAPTEDRMAEIKSVFDGFGLSVQVGG